MIKKIVGAVVVTILLATLLYPTLNSFDSPIYTSTPISGEMDVFVIDGQSNAENWLIETTLEEINATIPAPSHSVYYSANSVYVGDFDLVEKNYDVREAYSSGSWNVGGYIAPFGQLWTETYGRDVLFINVAVGSATVSSLTPEGAYGPYAKRMIETALESFEGIELNYIGWIWAQGESNATVIPSAYISEFDKIQSFMSSYGFEDCYVIKTADRWGGNSILATQMILNNDSSVHMVSTLPDSFTQSDGTLAADGVHYTQKGRDIIAQDLIKNIPGPGVTESDSPVKLFMIIPVIVVGALIISLMSSRRD